MPIVKTGCPVCGGRHAALCHKCPHSEAVRSGAFADAEWSSVPCSGCSPLKDDRARHIAGGDVVTLDVYEHGEIPRDDAAVAGDDDTPVRAAVLASLGALLRLHPMTREVIIRRMLGDPWTAVCDHIRLAFKCPTSIQMLHQRFARALKASGDLRAIFPKGSNDA